MRAFRLSVSAVAAALVCGWLTVAPAGADAVDPLEAFGGSAYPGLLVDSQLAEAPVVEPSSMYVELARRYAEELAQAAAEDDVNDPLEPVNRVIFQFNEAIYTGLFDPIAKSYNTVFPKQFRLSVSNLIDHVASPVTLANDLLQFEFTRAAETLARFLVNTFAGIGGLADAAAASGVAKHEEDFGQTLGVWGMGEGLYLVLPLLGPSNPRDAVGKYLVDPYFDPLGLWLSNTDRDAAAYTRMGVSGLDEYAAFVDELEQIRKTSVDYYAAIRSLYRQKRTTLINNGQSDDLPAIPNYDLNLGPDSDGGLAGVK